MNLHAVVSATPLTAEQLILLSALLLLAMVVLAALDNEAEMEAVADELDRLPELTRRSVRRVTDKRRWR